jgi:holliday junction DNA helicase RuvB
VEEREALEVNAVRPSSLRHIVGQRSVVEIVTTEIDAAQMDNKKFDHALMVGPPGCGKTSVSHIVAEEMAAPFIEVDGLSVKNLAELNALLLSAKEEKTIIFIDEAAELDPSMQVALYMALDQRKIVVSGTKSGGSPLTIPLADFTLLLATTHEADLLQPLRDRMRLVLRFQFYSDQELTELVRLRTIGLRWPVDAEVLPEIAKRSRGTPRLALRLLQSCRRVCRSLGEHTITLQHFRRACVLEQTDELGLGPTEQHYLNILSNGATRLNVLASMLGLPTKTVSDVVESFLLRSGLIVKDDQSRRTLTQKGLDRCRNPVRLPSDS